MLIGLSGRSGSGKTTLSKKLKAIFKEDASIVSLDNYFSFKNADFLNESYWKDCLESFLNDIEKLRKGEPITTSVKSKDYFESISINPAKYTIVEGFMLFPTSSLASLYDKRIFIDLDEKEIVRRRLKRIPPLMRKSTDEQEIVNYIESLKARMLKQKSFADLVLSGTDSIASNVTKTIDLITEENFQRIF